jgi:ABC-2 type transport system ATP-binding protein
MSDRAVVVRNLAKCFKPNRHQPAAHVVLRNVSLEVAAGEIVGLIGSNGAGKTTLLEILSTLLLPTSGDAFVQDRSVVSDPAAVKKLVGYCPCSPDSFYPRLTAAANLEFFAALYGLSPQASKRRIDEVCDVLGMRDSLHLDFQRHSSGMKQKLSLARALIIDPAVLLLDEPTKSFDPMAQHECGTLLRETVVGRLRKTILLVTHSLSEAQEVCDRIVVLQDGALHELAQPRSITHRDLSEMFKLSAPHCEPAHV